MNNVLLGLLTLMGTATAVYTDTPEKMMQIYDEILLATYQVTTAGDMHSMTVMLSAGYIMDRDLPSVREFESWLEDTFKENNVKELKVDHWGNPYIYTVSKSGKEYTLRSNGPDGLVETNDDLVIHGP
jgi:general secretion pathway protein G